MSWLTIAWSMCAGICVMLGFLHILLWFKSHSNISYLLSVVMAFSAGAGAMAELALMHSQSLETYPVIMQWENLFVFMLLMPMVWLVYIELGTAKRWLALNIFAIWGVAIIINFTSPGSLVFTEINELRQQTTFWGEQFTVALGPTNPWKLLPDVASLLILIYVVDASVRALRRGQRRKALLIGGSIVVFMLLAGIHAPLVDAGIVATPYMVSFAFLAIVSAMSYELVTDAVQVPKLNMEIRANEKRWRDLLENVQLAVIDISPQGLISYTNPFFQGLTGYSEQDLRHRAIADLIPAADEAELKQRLQEAAETGPRPHSQWTIVCASGEHRQIDWSSVKQQNSDGNYAGILAVGADITERLAAQRELQHTQIELERLTRASMLGELASALAHELNQPLAAILSNSQAALRFMENDNVSLEELREILEDIVRDDKRAGEVIQSLRAMLRRGEIKRESVSLRQVINEVVTILGSELSVKHIELRVTISDDLPNILAGRVETQQVIMNLLLNAIHVTENLPQNLRVIDISAHHEDNFIVVSVNDNGPGIPSDNLNKIFNAFHTSKTEGIGMGLVICKRIIEAHGGNIRAENNPQGGATFVFALPIGN